MPQSPPLSTPDAETAGATPTVRAPAPSSAHRRFPIPRWQSSELLGTAQEIEIEHGATVYRLRLTSLGKLILTK